MMARSLPDWLKAYQTLQANTEPAAIFDKWVGYSVIASALRKKVSLPLGRINIYPSMYVVFVAEPGIARKSQAISYGLSIMSTIPEIVCSADASTKEALLDDLETSAMDSIMPNNDSFRHSSLNIISKEFESFLGQKKENTKMLVLLTDLFDCQELPWKYRTKHSGSNIIPSVFINLLAATTPDSLASSLPPTAVGGGLTSRILFVWADAKKKKVPKPELTPGEVQLRELILKDFYLISLMAGQFKFDKNADKKWDEWYMQYEELDPSRICKDPSYNGWYSRKPLYILKVSILAAASKSDDMILTWDLIEEAMGDIEELELQMGNVFRSIGKSVVASEVDTVMQLIRVRKVITEKQLLSMTHRDIDSDKFDNVIATASRTGKVTRRYRGPKGEIGDIWYYWTGDE
jgi:hypothetical protein